jgi:hypothetical protein
MQCVAQAPGRIPVPVKQPATTCPKASRATSGAAASSSRDTAVDYFANDRRPIILFDGICNMYAPCRLDQHR